MPQLRHQLVNNFKKFQTKHWKLQPPIRLSPSSPQMLRPRLCLCPSLHLTPGSRLQAPTHSKTAPSHHAHVVAHCLGLPRLLCPSFVPHFTSLWRMIDLPCETHTTVLLSSPISPLLLTHFPPFYPSSSSPLLVPFSWPHPPPPPLRPTQRMTSHPLFGLTEGSFI